MKQFPFYIIFIILLSACKSEFESIRNSGDRELMLNKALEFYDKKEYAKAQALFEVIIPFYRGREQAEDIFYKYAYTYYYGGEYITASHYFKNFANSFYNSPHREEMEYMAAYSHYLMSPNYRLDQTYTRKAIDEFQLFTNLYPNSDKIPLINNLIDEMREKLERKAFESAILYYNLGHYRAAVQTFDNVLQDYPGSPRSEEARFLKLKSSYILAENSIYERKEERFDETLKFYSEFIKRHPRSRWMKEARDIYNSSVKELQKFGRV
ncbi:MAG TPA: outer membrane protein assembly factor BamD [Saprospiraceae bacterium]|nr:outer membrane protein assembly factor BamD [Saprospiraceae bacterium]